MLQGLLAGIVWLPIEAALLSKFGSTPGKWILDIRVTSATGSLLTLNEALGRAYHVLCYGLGCGLPPASYYAQWISYHRLTFNGRTDWDRTFGSVVRHDRLKVWKLACAIVLAVLVGVLYSVQEPTTV